MRNLRAVVVTTALFVLCLWSNAALAHGRVERQCKKESDAYKQWIVGWSVEEDNSALPTGIWRLFMPQSQSQSQEEYLHVLSEASTGMILLWDGHTQGRGRTWYNPCRYPFERDQRGKWTIRADFPLKTLIGWIVKDVSEPPFGFKDIGLPPKGRLILSSSNGEKSAWVHYKVKMQHRRIGEIINYDVSQFLETGPPVTLEQWYNPKYHRSFREVRGEPLTEEEMGLGLMGKVGGWTVVRQDRGIVVSLSREAGGPFLNFDLVSPDRSMNARVGYWVVEGKANSLYFYEIYRGREIVERSTEYPRPE